MLATRMVKSLLGGCSNGGIGDIAKYLKTMWTYCMHKVVLSDKLWPERLHLKVDILRSRLVTNELSGHKCFGGGLPGQCSVLCVTSKEASVSTKPHVVVLAAHGDIVHCKI